MPRNTPDAIETIRILARAADLPLSDDHARTVTRPLLAWIESANELSRKMSAPEHLERMPATAFTHPEG